MDNSATYNPQSVARVFEDNKQLREENKNLHEICNDMKNWSEEAEKAEEECVKLREEVERLAADSEEGRAMNQIIIGHCPKCGSHVYADKGVYIGPPSSMPGLIHTCSCRPRLTITTTTNIVVDTNTGGGVSR